MVVKHTRAIYLYIIYIFGPLVLKSDHIYNIYIYIYIYISIY